MIVNVIATSQNQLKNNIYTHIHIWAPHCFALPVTMINILCEHNNFFVQKKNYNFTRCLFFLIIIFLHS